MDTFEPMVSPGPEAFEPELAPTGPNWGRRALIALLVIVAVYVAQARVQLPYFAIGPGSAPQVSDFVVAPKDKQFPPRGHVLLVTVSFRDTTPVDYLEAQFDDDIQLESKKPFQQGLPKGQNLTQFNEQLMSDSEQAAAVVALRKLNYPVPETGEGAFVVDVTKGAPADGHLRAGDTITAIDGSPVHLRDDAGAAIQGHRPGQVVKASVHPARGADRTETLTAGYRSTEKGQERCRPGGDAPGRESCLGVIIQTRNQSFKLPFKVRIDAGSIGGPSAGLAFTLGLIDQLTPGELTGGRKVAATGTIDLGGTVGEVGGVRQKTAAVIATGARYFLVPPAEFKEAAARAKGHHLTVIKVATLDEALAVLGRLGGDVSVVRSGTQAGH